MEIRTGLEGLNSLLGVNTAEAAVERGKNQNAPLSNPLPMDHATLSSAASEIAQAAASDGIRTDKVSEVRAAIANGTYSVPSSAVASKVIDSMLNSK